ncbi:MAG: hypothetical protein JW889_04415 [Verrucomicrobia bacterium]|nr:hypothetical protein [Verrucomicrobiota bacterium]
MRFEAVFPLWSILAAVAAYLVVVLLVSRHPVLGKRRGLRMLLLALRYVVIAVVALCLLNPNVVLPRESGAGRRVVIVVDDSRSTALPAEGRASTRGTRLDEMKAAIADSKLLDQFSDDVDVQIVAVGREPRAVKSLDEVAGLEPATHLLAAIDKTIRDAPQARTEAVVVFSDGIDTTQDSIERTVLLLNRYAVPVYTYGLGSPEPQRDVAVENIAVKKNVIAQTEVEVDVFLRQNLCDGRTVPITITQDERVVATSGVTFTRDTEKVSVRFTPDQEGLLTYNVNVGEQDGELLIENNHVPFTVNAAKKVIRVLYMEGTMYKRDDRELWEYQYLEHALKGDGAIEVESMFRDKNIDAFRAGVSWVRDPINGFPTSKRDLFEYDVIISSDIDIVYFSDEQLEWLVDFVGKHGGGYVMVGGWTSFGSGGYDESIIDKMLPVDMRGRMDGYIEGAMFKWSYTPEGRSHPILQIDGKQNAAALDSVPYFRGCSRVIRAKPAATTLAEHPTARSEFGAMPLLAVQEFGKGRSMAFVPDTTAGWGAEFEDNWGIQDNRHFQAFWINAVRWLAEHRLQMPVKNLVVETPRASFGAGEDVPITATVLDENYEPTAAAEVVAVIARPDGETTMLRLAPDHTETGKYSALYSPADEGDYTVAASATLNSAKLDEDALRFRATSPNVEFKEYRRNDALLERLASLTGGAVLDDAALKSLPGRITAAVALHKQAALTKPIWDRLWLLGALLLCLFVEWSVRRRSGLA